MRFSRAIYLFALLLPGCAGPDDDLERGNSPPEAVLRAPVIAPVGLGPECIDDTDCVPSTGCSLDPECLHPGGCVVPVHHCRVRFDASGSIDFDADPLTFVFQFGDGSEALHTSDPIAFHAFRLEAVYEVLVRAIDLHGEESLAAQDVSVRADFPANPDFCGAARQCSVGDECTAGVCYATGGTLE